ncbi:MAG TPA: right-handed parallel beta-helix repeat-containing protein [Verrucomicrobiota bacterium]|nr:right-handed parallel beta-helix repeat-containing protein [Verrucomicrobiota bacterium]HRZ36344.1 right-handed parallel beta-helix repeat-containing protein [Candidatus Paceibacterota bacterium]
MRIARGLSYWVVLTLELVAINVHAADFHVAPHGNDANPGTRAKPLATLERARDAVRELKHAGPLTEPVTVWMQDGNYPLSREVRFGPEDSGTAACPITYTAAEGAAVVLDGGRRVTGWKKHNDILWVADVPDVASGSWRFRQLYVNGQQRVRARTPNQGYLLVAGCPEGTPKTAHYHKDCQTFQFKPGDIRPDWSNLSDVEVIVYHFWTDSHLPIKAVDTVSNLVTFAHKAGKTFTDDFSEEGARYIVENVFEGLDAPGEWYLNRQTGQLFYYPMPGEDPTRAEVVAPFAATHVRLEGNPAERRYVEHLHFRNLAFVHSRFELPAGNSNDQQGSASVPATITLRGARHCAFEQCRLSNLGTFAFDVMAGCEENNSIEFNHIHHIGGVLSDMGGIYTLGVSPGTVIRNNHIHDVDANHYGGWGIYHDEGSTHLLVENNVVHHTKCAPFNIHFAKEVTVRNNIFALGKLEQASRGRTEPHKSVFFENNIVYWREGELLSKN